jgi:hypothetical protein
MSKERRFIVFVRFRPSAWSVSRRVAEGDYSIEYSHRLGEFILP